MFFLLSTITTYAHINICAHNGLHSNRKLEIRGDREFPPYEYIDDNGNPAGFNVEILDAIMKEVQIPYNLELIEWHDIVADFKDRKIDVISGVSAAEAPDTLCESITPIIYMNQDIVSLKKSGIGTISDIKGKNIITYWGEDKKDYPSNFVKNNRFTEIPFIIDGLRLVSNGKQDLMLCPKELVEYYIEKHDMNDLRVLHTNLSPRSYGLLVHKENDSLKYLLNKGMDIIKANGEYDRIYNKWFGVDNSSTIKIIGLILGFIAIAIMIFYLIVFWLNYRIKRATIDISLQREQLDLAIRAGNILVWGYDVKSDMLYNIVGETVANGRCPLKDASIVIHPDDAWMFFDKINDILSGASPEGSIVVRCKYPNTDKWDMVEKEFATIKDKSGNIVRIIGTHKDITDRLKKQEHTQDLLRKYKMIFNSASVLMEVYDKLGRKIEISSDDNEVYNSENIQSSFYDNEYINDDILQALKDRKTSTLTVKYEYDKVGKGAQPYNGKYFVKTTITPILYEDSGIEHIIVTYVDITESVIMAQSFEQFNNEKSQIVESLPMGLMVFNKGGDFEYANSEYCSLLGIKKIEDAPAYIENIFTNPNLPIEERSMLIDGKSGSYFLKLDFDKIREENLFDSSLSGSRNIMVFYRTVYNIDGGRKNFLLIFMDITESYRYRTELEERHRQIQLAIQVNKMMQWTYDCKTKSIEINSEDTDTPIFSFEWESDIIHPEDRVLVKDIKNKLDMGDATDFSVDIRMKMPSADSWRFFTMSGVPMKFSSDGKVKKYAGFWRENTEWYNLTQELKTQNELNQLILKNITSGLVYIDRNHKVVWENVSEKFPMGTADDSLFIVGRKCESTHGVLKPECDSCLLSSVLKKDIIATTEKQLSSGQVVEINANSVVNDMGEIIGVVMRIDDVTTKRQLYNELEDAKNRAEYALQLLSEVLDKIPSMIFIKDADNDFRYILANDTYRKSMGVNKDDIIGKNDDDLMPPDAAKKYKDDDLKVLNNPGISVIIDEESARGGIISYIQTNKSLIVTPDGKRLIVAFAIDLTDIHAVNVQLKKAKDKAEESDRLKSAFLANMSHEIRTPLNAIVGFSDLLTTTEDPEDREMYNNIIATNNDMLLRLINDILDLSKLDAGSVELLREDVDISALFKELEISLMPRFTNPDVKLVVINPFDSCIAAVDSGRMMQVLMNFVNNAIKYTPKGTITVGYEIENNGLKLYVKDTGIGIPEDKKDKVFGRFEKLDQFAQGTGLGLSICKGISEINGGNIGFTSTYGKGSTFWTWKPVKTIINKGTSTNNSYINGVS